MTRQQGSASIFLVQARQTTYLPSQFERNGLQIALRSTTSDVSSHRGRPGESDLVNIHMIRQGLSGDRSKTSNDVPGTCWPAYLFHELSQEEDMQRGVLCALEDNRASSW
jgi:hypothetical protein